MSGRARISIWLALGPSALLTAGLEGVSKTDDTGLKPWLPAKGKWAACEGDSKRGSTFSCLTLVYSKHSTSIWRRHLLLHALFSLPASAWPQRSRWPLLNTALSQVAQPPQSPRPYITTKSYSALTALFLVLWKLPGHSFIQLVFIIQQTYYARC